MATATPRSRAGNHSATVLLAPGQLNPSPIPSMIRKMLNDSTEFARAGSMLETNHHRRCFSGFATVICALAESDDLQLNTLAMLPALESREPSGGRSVLRLD